MTEEKKDEQLFNKLMAKVETVDEYIDRLLKTTSGFSHSSFDITKDKKD